jgi:hypothetical protein
MYENYACLVLLGEKLDGDHVALDKARHWILSHGSATAMPQWGKVWLSVCVKTKCDSQIKQKNTIFGGFSNKYLTSIMCFLS